MPSPQEAAIRIRAPSRSGVALALAALGAAAIDGAILWRELDSGAAALDARIAEWADERRAAFDAVVAQVEDAALFQAEALAADPALREAFAKALGAGEHVDPAVAQAGRAALVRRLADYWALGEERHGLRQLHFHAGPEGRSYLRVHAPAWRGDPTGPSRPLVAAAFRTRAPQSGFGVGLTGPSLRGVAPIADPPGSAAPPVGAIEVGIGFEAVFRRVTETAGGDFAILLDAEAAAAGVAEAFRREIVHDGCDCIVTAATQPEIAGLLPELPDDFLAQGLEAGLAVSRFASPVWTLPERWMSAAVWPLAAEGGGGAPVGWVVTWADVTEAVLARKAQDRMLVVASAAALAAVLLMLWGAMRYAIAALKHVVREKTRAIEASRREAVEANHAKSRFLATMSHEIRTPLNGVLGMADLLSATGLDARQRRMLETIRASGDILLATIGDVLDASKIETGALTLETAPFDAETAAARVRDIHAASAAKKGLALTLSVKGEATGRLGDAHRVQQILHNLVSNAIKFTETGAVAVSIDARSRDALEIAVTDTGIGMTPEQARRAFEPFTQADASITRRFGGTGLGLSIVRSLAEAMGGGVAVDSSPGVGSTFRVRLALAATAGSPRETRAETPVGAEALAGLFVLAADDNEINRAVLAGLLEREGVRADIRDGGAAVIAAFRAGGPFDAVLLDISMPEIDGIAAMRAIRAAARERGSAVPPIYACTASVMPEEIAALRAEGFDGFIAKPLTAEAVSLALAQIVRVGPAQALAS